jgi:hypothetical protein
MLLLTVCFTGDWCALNSIDTSGGFSNGSHIYNRIEDDSLPSFVEYSLSFTYTGSYSLDIAFSSADINRPIFVALDGVTLGFMQAITASHCADSRTLQRFVPDLPINATGMHQLRLTATFGMPVIDYLIAKHVCVPLYVGSLCQYTCTRASACSGNGACIWDQGTCNCDPGFTGSTCQVESLQLIH